MDLKATIRKWISQDRYRHAIDTVKLAIVAVARVVWRNIVQPAVSGIAWIMSHTYKLARPTLLPAWRANQKLSNETTRHPDNDSMNWYEKLQACPDDERELVLATLLSTYESDQSRIRGVESKARGVLQTAGLVFAGDAVAINLAVTDRGPHSTTVFWLVAVSSMYLAAAIWAALYVDKPGERHVLDLKDILPPERAGAALAVATKLNRTASISRTNLTESAIFDAARALVMAAAALVSTVVAA